MATVKEFTRMGLPPQTHGYDDPSLDPLQFLTVVYRDSSLPMSIRIDAARGLLPYTEPRPASIPLSYVGCKIIIPPFESRTPDHEAHEGDNRKSQSFPEIANNNPHPQSGGPGPPNMMRDPDPSPFIDYSIPPDPAVFEVALKYGYPAPHLCAYCGHWLTTTYPDCICASRDPSKMN